MQEDYLLSSVWEGCSKIRLFKPSSLSLEKIMHPNWTLPQMLGETVRVN